MAKKGKPGSRVYRNSSPGGADYGKASRFNMQLRTGGIQNTYDKSTGGPGYFGRIAMDETIRQTSISYAPHTKKK